MVVDPSKDNTLEEIERFSAKKINLRMHCNPKHLGRAQSVLVGLKLAQGEVIIISSLDLSVPLAEVFNFLQEFVTNPATQMTIGNRCTSKKKRTGRRSSWHLTLENIIAEKAKRKDLAAADPACSILGFRKIALDKILSQLKLSSWFYGPELLLVAQKNGIPVLDIPIVCNDRAESKIPLLREYLRNLI